MSDEDDGLIERLERLADDVATVRPAFDTAYYLSQNPDVAAQDEDPLFHYCLHGWREGRDPAASFSTRFYLGDNPQVAQSGQNPFVHYLLTGRAAGRPALPPTARPAPAAPDPDELKKQVARLRPHLDAGFYRRSNPDVAEAGLDPVTHYCTHGWREGRDPMPGFSTRFYIQDNPDVARAGVNPFWHYLTTGKAQGRKAQRRDPAVEEERRLLGTMDMLRSHFDTGYYLSQNPDVADAGLDPLRHYCSHGWREARDPSPGFSTRFYLENTPDLIGTGINPFWHYIAIGQREGRKGRPDG